MYVVVNVSRPWAYAWSEGQFALMPGEEPHTYTTLEEAVACQARLALEYGHSIDSAPVYELVPVPDEEVVPLFKGSVERLKSELDEQHDG